MSQVVSSSSRLTLTRQQSAGDFNSENTALKNKAGAQLAAAITKEASIQTYYTIRYLVDRPLVADAYRAYAYFRWVDDLLDQGHLTPLERLDFLARQQGIVRRCFQGDKVDYLYPEEQLVVDLIQNNQTNNHGLRIYLDQMMAVMALDVKRFGRLISAAELDEYTLCLATAVTEALHYFIGHDEFAPQDETRYLAVIGAHITHMLRDMVEDTAVGYYNIPQEYLETRSVDIMDVNCAAFRDWVCSQVHLARDYFAAGRNYLAQVENLRCRLAGYAYIARFEIVLDAIEEDNYRLRAAYPERKSKKACLKMFHAALTQTIVAALPGKPFQ
ncbi:MAG: squalene/phytoene synthase family protein [Anaerolineales bacterium]|nr:squalene/phytoene synthase family protein [Anaerolineales bacterium]